MLKNGWKLTENIEKKNGENHRELCEILIKISWKMEKIGQKLVEIFEYRAKIGLKYRKVS